MTVELDILAEARKALESEIKGLEGLKQRLGAAFEAAVQVIADCKGKVVVTGMGKSGHIGSKIASTLASTGTPAFFLHPAEAIHGDLGMLGREDVVLALSNSGQTEELLRLLPALRRMGVPLIVLTGNEASALAEGADVVLDASVSEEACPLNLAPTSSTTAALALGDALAVVLLKLKRFTPEDFALFHPGGSLGKKLMTTAADLMAQGEHQPLVRLSTPIREAIEEIQAKHWGITGVVNEQGVLVGAFSMGDFTRLHLKNPDGAFMDEPVATYMVKTAKTVQPETLAAKALYEMEQHHIRALFVVNDAGHPAGIVGIYEVLKAIDYD